jgi:hypothetical protein
VPLPSVFDELSRASLEPSSSGTFEASAWGLPPAGTSTPADSAQPSMANNTPAAAKVRVKCAAGESKGAPTTVVDLSFSESQAVVATSQAEASVPHRFAHREGR